MTGEPEADRADRRCRWRKKRWRAAGLLRLAATYPVGYGPVIHAYCRG